MRKLFPMLAVCGLFLVASLSVLAADDKEKTITGDATCAKCALKETKECQNVLMLKEDGKDVTYYLVGDASKKAHGKLGICTASKDAPIKVKVTGTAGEKDGKKIIEVTKIDKAD